MQHTEAGAGAGAEARARTGKKQQVFTEVTGREQQTRTEE